MDSLTLASRTPEVAGAAQPAVVAATPKRPSGGFLRYLFRARRWIALLSLALLSVVLLATFVAPWIYDWKTITQVNLDRALQGPGGNFWLGTDELGRDLLGRVLWGARITLTVAFGSVAMGMTVGVSLGALCGFYSNAFTATVMRLMDFMIAFPRTLVAIMVVAIAGNSIMSLTVAIAISTMPIYVRFFAAPVQALKRREFVLASRAIGVGDLSLVLTHIIPNIGSLIIVQATTSLAEAILIGSGLSFLGLGPPPPIPEWGAMIANSRAHLTSHPHVLLAPGCALFIVILSFNLVGDALRDYVDPRSRQSQR
ncbi:ABC transporter permease [Pigmentiphaga aceris]|uniref:ABC transporter permease n=1 Tax=Pigmentiphaga aceris TaxID=1940612 RepID=A0A5C0B6K7_9BURK|nr:ABC transporter permease [Pigmentiphaga aceris]QEI08571.1 ABC transporter permease [Pigmentiphaga aceris]